jgi:hypothetical protein
LTFESFSDDLFRLSEYKLLAAELLRRGHYSGLIEAIRACSSQPGSFIVIDSCSGTGKSLAGVALRTLDKRYGFGGIRGITGQDLDLTVIHAIWPDSVGSQDIYGDIRIEQLGAGVSTDNFWARANQLFSTNQERQIPEQREIWLNLLTVTFQSTEASRIDRETFLVDEFKLAHNIKKLVVFIDEVPSLSEDIRKIGFIRDC